MNEFKGKVLAVDDNEDILFALKLLLKPHVDKITTISSPDRVIDLLKVEDYDIVLLDMNFTKDASSGQEGFEVLKHILEHSGVPFLCLLTPCSNPK